VADPGLAHGEAEPEARRQGQAMKTLIAALVDEARLVFCDAGVLIITVLAVVVYSFVYPIPYLNQALKNVPVAVVDGDHSGLSRRLVRMADEHEAIRIAEEALSTAEAERLVRSGAVRGVLVIPRGFERDVLEGRRARLSGYIDASYLLAYNAALTGILETAGTVSAGVEVARWRAGGLSREAALRARRPVGLELRPLFNATSGYATYVVPAVLVLILQQTLLIGIGMAGGARRERITSGSTAPVDGFGHPVAQVLGRSIPYLLLYGFNAAYYFAFIPRYYGFYVPGSGRAVALLTVPFLLATVFMGFALRAFFSKRETAMQVILFTSLPFVFLGGFAWPAEAVPAWLHRAAQFVPTTTAIPAFLRLMRQGASLADVTGEASVLWALTAIYLPAACAAEYAIQRRARRSRP
jgi:ABC-2 type transport system permease protein